MPLLYFIHITYFWCYLPCSRFILNVDLIQAIPYLSLLLLAKSETQTLTELEVRIVEHILNNITTPRANDFLFDGWWRKLTGRGPHTQWNATHLKVELFRLCRSRTIRIRGAYGRTYSQYANSKTPGPFGSCYLNRF